MRQVHACRGVFMEALDQRSLDAAGLLAVLAEVVNVHKSAMALKLAVEDRL